MPFQYIINVLLLFALLVSREATHTRLKLADEPVRCLLSRVRSARWRSLCVPFHQLKLYDKHLHRTSLPPLLSWFPLCQLYPSRLRLLSFRLSVINWWHVFLTYVPYALTIAVVVLAIQLKPLLIGVDLQSIKELALSTLTQLSTTWPLVLTIVSLMYLLIHFQSRWVPSCVLLLSRGAYLVTLQARLPP